MSEVKFNMSASIRNLDGSSARTRLANPLWPHLEEELRSAFTRGGSISIDREGQLEIGSAAGCSLRGEPGQYLLMATIFGATGDRVIRWREPEDTPERGKLDIAGDEWDARSVVTNLAIAIRVFKEVFDTGELSEETMRHMR